MNDKKTLKTILNTIATDDRKIVSTQPKFERNPLGYIAWGIIKQKNAMDIERKMYVLRKCCENGVRGVSRTYRTREIHDQISNLHYGDIEKGMNTLKRKVAAR